MTARLWVAVVSLLAIAGLGWLGRPYQGGDTPGARAAAERPALALLTSLPLVFGEGFSLEGGGSPALARLEQRYRVVPISVADAASLKGQNLLLLAHPRAQPASALVDLDRWVREGGSLLLLADPKLDWPSGRPVGDVLRPPPMFADTGLLKHWGLTLNAPDVAGPVLLGGGHNPVVFLSAGQLVSTNANCEIYRADIIAECTIGKGKVAVVADADFLNASAMENYGGFAENQLSELMQLLATLETR